LNVFATPAMLSNQSRLTLRHLLPIKPRRVGGPTRFGATLDHVVVCAHTREPSFAGQLDAKRAFVRPIPRDNWAGSSIVIQRLLSAEPCSYVRREIGSRA